MLRTTLLVLLALNAAPLALAAGPEVPLQTAVSLSQDGSDVALAYSTWLAAPNGHRYGADGGAATGGDDGAQTPVYVGCDKADDGAAIFHFYDPDTRTHYYFYVASRDCAGNRIYRA